MIRLPTTKFPEIIIDKSIKVCFKNDLEMILNILLAIGFLFDQRTLCVGSDSRKG